MKYLKEIEYLLGTKFEPYLGRSGIETVFDTTPINEKDIFVQGVACKERRPYFERYGIFDPTNVMVI